MIYGEHMIHDILDVRNCTSVRLGHLGVLALHCQRRVDPVPCESKRPIIKGCFPFPRDPFGKEEKIPLRAANRLAH